MNKEDICFMSAWQMREKIFTQELSSQEITETLIERIEKVNPLINAYCTPTFELAREMAKDADKAVKNGENLGLIHGLPISIKDEMPIKGIRTTFGSKIYENNISKEDDLCVRRLKNEGCVILGKTNMPEFGHHGFTRNLIFGETLNPWNLEKTSGGSSGGAAAAVASGLGPLALGSDAGGSIRNPCSFCGLFGIKSSSGRVPVNPNLGLLGETLLDQNGPITRFVKDAALMLDAIKGCHHIDRYSLIDQNISYFESIENRPNKIKIGYSLNLGFAKAIEPIIEEKVLDGVHKFEELGYLVEEVKIKLKRPDYAFNIIWPSMFAYDLRTQFKKWKDKISPTLVKFIEAGATYSILDYLKAQSVRQQLYLEMSRYFKNYDLLITPTMAVTAFDKGTNAPNVINGKSVPPTAFTAFTFPFNLTGHPAASIPCGWSNKKLPIGMQIIGNRFNELLIFQASYAFEEIASWQDKRPSFT
jgi:Asp-tRNA(Asn)/Glu-tRNA(Gln) amidotransferase A subunit family amidase